MPEPKSPRVDERHRKPCARGVRGGRRADHAASDHEQVERRSLERLARGGAPPRVPLAHSGFVHARRPAASTTSTRAKGASAGQVEPRRDDVVLGSDLEDLRSVAVAEPARVHRRPARPPGQQRHRAGGRAAHHHLAVPHLDVVDQRAGAAVEPPRRAARRGRSPRSARRGSTSTRDRSRSPGGGCRRSRAPGQIRPSSSSSSQCTDEGRGRPRARSPR